MLGWMRRPLLLAAAGLVLLVVVVARGGSPVPSDVVEVPEFDLPKNSGGLELPGSGPVQPASEGDGTLVYVIIGALAGLLLLTAVVLSVRAALRRGRAVRVGDVETATPGEVLAPKVPLERAVVRAREVLSRPGGAPGDAVIGAWLALEHATDGRRPHQTATEFTDGLAADEHALAELRSLYQRARFSTAPTTDDDVALARAALDRILVSLR